jgi:WD40 repeat protein
LISFVQENKEPIKLSTPHLYVSALPWIQMHSSLSHLKKSFSNTHIPHKDILQMKDTVTCRVIPADSDIYCIAFSPDGKHIVSGSSDKTVRVWDAQTGAPVGDPFTGHSDSVISVAYSPDGKYIASGSSDNTVRVWDTPHTPHCLDEEKPLDHKPESLLSSVARDQSPSRAHQDICSPQPSSEDLMFASCPISQLHDTSSKKHQVCWLQKQLLKQAFQGHGTWDGRVHHGNKLLFWVPEFARETVRDNSRLCIGQYGIRVDSCDKNLDFTRFHYGEDWAKVYTPDEV